VGLQPWIQHVPGMRVIVCATNKVINHTGGEYAALSYCIGPPSRKPPDAVECVKALGYRYLWVDQFCINQHDKTELTFACTSYTPRPLSRLLAWRPISMQAYGDPLLQILSRSPSSEASPAAPSVPPPSTAPARLTRVGRERKVTQKVKDARAAGWLPDRRPGGDSETQHQDSLYRDWRRRAQMVISIVVGSVGIRNMFYHTNFGGEGRDHFRK
jgi:hypothetical protein